MVSIKVDVPLSVAVKAISSRVDLKKESPDLYWQLQWQIGTEE